MSSIRVNGILDVSGNGRFPLRKQKSISDTTSFSKSNEPKRFLRKQSSVDHVTANVSATSTISFGRIMWSNSSSSLQNLTDSSLKIIPSNVIKKRAQISVASKNE